MDLSQRIIKIQENIEEMKTKKANLEGSKETLTEQLKTQFGFDTIDEAKDALSEYNLEIEKLEEEMEKEIENIENEFGF